jgi:hypothetical protein
MEDFTMASAGLCLTVVAAEDWGVPGTVGNAARKMGLTPRVCILVTLVISVSVTAIIHRFVTITSGWIITSVHTAAIGIAVGATVLGYRKM